MAVPGVLLRYRIGIDVGGTFTDGVLLDDESGAAFTAKVPSTPRDPSLGFFRAFQQLLEEASVSAAMVQYLAHGTTVITNAVFEGSLARTALVTTEGFRDILEIARQNRPSLYDLQFEKPDPLVPRHLCFGVPERLNPDGSVLIPLDEDIVRLVVAKLREEGVEAVAVCLLHSYANPAHEKRVGAILRAELPDVAVSLSSEVSPEIREFFRTSTTVVNAATQLLATRYFNGIETQLDAEELSGRLMVMQGNGGVLTFSAARQKPVFLVESGPAAGVMAAAFLSRELGYEDVISLDMGGTTAKTAVVRGGKPRVAREYEIGTVAGATEHGPRGYGYPVRTPVVDLVEVGAGGGSIAWVDKGGALRVGPQSAGADPGPACFRNGGMEPTLTDANLILGRLNPTELLGGAIRPDLDAAESAIHSRCAEPLGLDLLDVAYGIVEIATTAMVSAMRKVSIQRGHDPRGFVLVAFGGAGPLHANALAAALGIPTTLIPMSPGLTSALGLLVADIKHELSATVMSHLHDLDGRELSDRFRALEVQGRALLELEGVGPDQIAFSREAEMRYVGQGHELLVSVPDVASDQELTMSLTNAFHPEHERVYGFCVSEEPVELVNVRVTAIGRIPSPHLRELGRKDDDPISAQKGVRSVYFAEASGRANCAIYERSALGVGSIIDGPAIVEEPDSTSVIHPGFGAVVDKYGNLVVRVKG